MAGGKFFLFICKMRLVLQLPYLDTFIFADPYYLNESIPSRDTRRGSDFRNNVMARDGEFCIVTGDDECQAAHLYVQGP